MNEMARQESRKSFYLGRHREVTNDLTLSVYLCLGKVSNKKI